jgi:ABC-type antimicrobial peptide transport system permease subunit
MYVPAIQGETPEWSFFVVRSRLGVEALAPALRAVVREVVPEFPLYDFRTLEERIASSIAPQRFNSLIVSAFAAAALVLVLVGIYGLVSSMARRRTREIAIRMALGGRRTEVVRPVVLGGLVPAAVGIVAGALLALPAGRALSSLLFGVEPSDPVVLLAVPLVLAAVVVVATYVPALRATWVDPGTALREG